MSADPARPPLLQLLVIILGALALAGCASNAARWSGGSQSPAPTKRRARSKRETAAHGKAHYCIPHHGCYHALRTASGYHAQGLASWYGLGATGKPTASGEPYDPSAMRVASKTLPFGTWLKIKNLMNQREVVAMVDDRGPFHKGRIVDGTLAVAKRLGYYRSGTAPISVTAIPKNKLSSAQAEAAQADEKHAVHYAKTHPHSVVAEAGKVTLHGVIDVTGFGLKLGVGTAVGVVKITGDVALHVLGVFF